MHIIKNFYKEPFSFVSRQLYRVIFVLPYHILMMAYYTVFGKNNWSKTLAEATPFCFIIGSVIYPTPNKKVSYGGLRSSLTVEERSAQTATTISSIRKHVPNAKIILVEGGLQPDLPGETEKMADQYIYLGNNKIVRLACDSKVKSLGEVIMLLIASKRFKFRGEYNFKISGRYYLSDQFNINDWKFDSCMFLPIRNDYFSTRLYGFSLAMFPEWKLALLKGLPFNLIDYAIENTMAKYIPKKYLHPMKKLGVSGLSGSTNEVITE